MHVASPSKSTVYSPRAEAVNTMLSLSYHAPVAMSPASLRTLTASEPALPP